MFDTLINTALIDLLDLLLKDVSITYLGSVSHQSGYVLTLVENSFKRF